MRSFCALSPCALSIVKNHLSLFGTIQIYKKLGYVCNINDKKELVIKKNIKRFRLIKTVVFLVIIH